MERGKLITIEGIDGAGKSTVAGGLTAALEARGIAIELLREPGGVATSERIRELVKDPEATIGARAEALLYAAARAQLVEEKLEPLLASGTWVLLDRFVDSSLAYQGAGRALGLEAVGRVNEFATGGLTPDLTLLLRIDRTTSVARQSDRGETADRLEREGDDFFTTIAAAYDELATAEPERIIVIDASQSATEVLTAAVRAVTDLLP